ncbi:MAG TPA: formimidoylglutamase [Gemmataceae bacterium]|nr:formimidoylglutamase [Gemmataceae bacterium]
MPRPEDVFRRSDDPRLGEVIEFWRGDAAALVAGRPVLVGFPQDEGVRRNHGRVGAAAGPRDIRHALWRLTPYDGAHDVDLAALAPLDAGNVRIQGSLEETQTALGEVVGGILEAGAIPVVLGGGHETAYGHFLGYLVAARPVGIINIDAHLDVRPFPEGHGHSGSPFRQALEHPGQPLPGERYVCLGAEPSAVSRAHVTYLRERGGVVRWAAEVRSDLSRHFRAECERLAGAGCQVYVTIDADVVAAAEVPGVSAPNALGLSGVAVAECAYLAGLSPAVSSLDVVEVNPRHDQDGRSVRWAALVVWQFLAGLAARRAGDRGGSKT